MSDWKGERMGTDNYDSVSAEHLHRYAIAIELAKDKRVLDIASGEGYGSQILSSVATHVTGVDISVDAISHARKKYGSVNNISFKTGSLCEIPMPDNSVDLVVCFESIEHTMEHDKIMVEIKRVLTCDGILLMSTPDKYQYSDLPNYKNQFHVHELYKDEFILLIKNFYKNSIFFSQRFYSGSLITPIECNKDNRIDVYTGDYNSIKKYDAGTEAMYIIAIASDSGIEYLSSSFFNLTQKIQKTYQESYDRILYSKSYKLGNFFIRKAAFLKNKLGI